MDKNKITKLNFQVNYNENNRIVCFFCFGNYMIFIISC